MKYFRRLAFALLSLAMSLLATLCLLRYPV